MSKCLRAEEEANPPTLKLPPSRKATKDKTARQVDMKTTRVGANGIREGRLHATVAIMLVVALHP